MSLDVKGRLLALRRDLDGDRHGIVNGPAFAEGCARRVQGEGLTGNGAAGDGEHGGVVDGVAEDGVGSGDADAVEGGDLVLVGGDFDEAVGDEAVDDRGTRAARTRLAGMPKRVMPSSMTQSLVELTAQMSTPLAWRSETRLRHLGEDVGFDAGGEEGAGGGAHLGLAEAVVHLDHLAADGELGDLAALVEAVAGVDPGRWSRGR